MFKRNHLERALRHAGGAGILALVSLAGPAGAADDASTSAIVITVDTPAEFKANGDFITIEGDVPADGLSGAAKVAVPGANWEFSIWHKVTSWDVNGANTLAACIEGKHLHGPHPPPLWVPSDIDPNALPMICKSKGVGEAKYGQEYFLSMTKKWDHPTTGAPHKDTYTLEAGCTARAGAPPKVEGKAVIVAKHEGNSTKKSQRKGKGLASLNSAVFYDAQSGSLTLLPGHIDILDTDGALSGGIEPQYLGDPIIETELVVLTLHSMGQAPDGRYRFSGGQVLLFDQAGDIALEGVFPEYLVGDTSRVEVLDSYGLMEQLTTEVAVREDAPGQPVSPFLYDFVHYNLLGEQMPPGQWQDIQGIDLAFVTPVSLAQMTQGFTQSAFSPATIVIAANRRWLDCPGDLNGDGQVGVVDFLTLLGNWGLGADGPPDLNGDGIVGVVDMLQMLGSWGQCPDA